MKQNTLYLLIAASLGILASPATFAAPSPNADSTTLNPPSGAAQAGAEQQVTWLGVYLDEVNPTVRSQLGALLGGAGGALISKVQDNSPAQQGGVQQYDIIVSIDDQAVNTAQDVYQAVQARKPSQPIKLGLIRQAQKQELSLMLGSRNVPAQQQSQRQMPTSPLQNPFGNAPNQHFWATPPNWNLPNWGTSWPGFNMPAMPDMNALRNQLQNGSNAQSFSHSESMKMRTLPNGKLRAEVRSKDSDGNDKEFIFEGDRDEIRKQVEAQQELSEQQKQNLLNSLQFGSSGGSPFDDNPWQVMGLSGFPSLNFNDPFFQPPGAAQAPQSSNPPQQPGAKLY